MLSKAPNMYESYILKKLLREANADEEQRRGRLATLTYAVSMIVVVVLIAVYYALKEETLLLELEHPTLAAYRKIAEYDPDCPCKLSAVTLEKVTQNVIKFNPVCDAAANLLKGCQDAATAAIANNTDNNVGINDAVAKCGVYAGSYSQSLVALKGVDRLCSQAWNLVDEEVKDFRHTRLVTTSLMHNSTFQSQLESMWTSTRNDIVSRFLLPLETTATLNIMERPLTAFTVGDSQSSNQPVSQSSGVAFLAKNANPPCNCYKSYECKTTIAQGTGFASLDVRCSVYQTLQTLDIGQMIDAAKKLTGTKSTKYTTGMALEPGKHRRRRLADETSTPSETSSTSHASSTAGGSLTTETPPTDSPEHSLMYEEDYGVVHGAGDFAGEPMYEFEFCAMDPGYYCYYDQGCFYKSPACEKYRDAHTHEGFGAMSGGPPAATTGTLDRALNQGFLDKFEVTNEFEIYYDNCHPVKCDYNLYGRMAPAAVVSAVLGLIGGISVGIKAAVGIFFGLDWAAITAKLAGIFKCACCRRVAEKTAEAQAAALAAAAPEAPPAAPEKAVELEAVGVEVSPSNASTEEEGKAVPDAAVATEAASSTTAQPVGTSSA